ncbi:pentapeptide repeat-containing protein [Bacillus sp. NP157]|nr:pentapeptide repeat-containing protein [Bacillus sp. NP157]
MSRADYQTSTQQALPHHLGEEPPLLPSRMPHPNDDYPWGLRIFRTEVEHAELSHLTLPRTFISRSLVAKSRLDDTDLSESFLCWNDFERVSFRAAVLARCDLRASHFISVDFTDADLSESDLRHSGFAGCTFEGANLSGAILCEAQAPMLALSTLQRDSICWTKDDGAEPDGG